MMYQHFAKVYDRLMYDFDYESVVRFLEQVLAMEEISVGKILEIACGTGSITERFAQKYYIDAFDRSEQMLALAEEKLRGTKARLFCQDMRTFIAPDRYNVVFCLCDSLNYVTDREQVKEVFRRVYQSMEDEGIFIFDLNTEKKFQDMESVYVDEVEDVVYIWENEYDQSAGINLYGVNFFLQRQDGLYERWYEEHREKAYEVEEIREMLLEAGFSHLNVYNGYTFDQKTDGAFRHVYVVRKQLGEEREEKE